MCSLGVCCPAALCTQLGTFSLGVLHLCLIFFHLIGNCSQHVKYVKTCSGLSFLNTADSSSCYAGFFSLLNFYLKENPWFFFFKLLVKTSLCCLLVLLNLVSEG